MMGDELYSVRMRASVSSRHVSGAERIVALGRIDEVMRELTARAMNKTAAADEIVVTVESLRGLTLLSLEALDVITVNAPGAEAGRAAAVRVLQLAGVSTQAALTAIDTISKGAAPSGGIMRGAAIMDAQTGERLEPDLERGVRVSRFDWSDEVSSAVDMRLRDAGLTHFRTKEALALAAKVAYAPGVVAELCWSDDPDYTAGYVASRGTGYVRFPFLKEPGEATGGRVFFVRRNALDLAMLLEYLQRTPVLISGPGDCKAAKTPEEYFSCYALFPDDTEKNNHV
jgi:6-carboxyhexanoate--CoA ligase